jgi:hypothetical protein
MHSMQMQHSTISFAKDDMFVVFGGLRDVLFLEFIQFNYIGFINRGKRISIL